MRLTQIFLMLFVLAGITIISCKKDDDSTMDDTTGTSLDEGYYFSATIDGKDILLEVELSGFSVSGGRRKDSSYFLAQYANIGGNMDVEGAFGVAGNFKGPDYPTIQDQIDLFELGSYEYGARREDTLWLEGALVDYTDSAGTYWTSDLVLGEQKGSYFRLTEVMKSPLNSDYDVIYTAEFECILYDKDGNAVELKKRKG